MSESVTSGIMVTMCTLTLVLLGSQAPGLIRTYVPQLAAVAAVQVNEAGEVAQEQIGQAVGGFETVSEALPPE